MVKAARLDGETFRELKEDNGATGQAVAVVALAGLSYGLGSTLVGGIGRGSISTYEIIVGTLATMILSIAAAFVWSFTAFLVGTKLFRGVTQYWGLARPLFFSTTPGLLFVLISIPIDLVSRILSAIVAGWILVAGVFAVKNAMGFSSERSMLTFIVGVLILLLVREFLVF